MSGAMDSKRASQTRGLSLERPSTRAVSVRAFRRRGFPLQGHEAIAAIGDRGRVDFAVERETGGIVDVGEFKDADPIEFRGGNELQKFLEVRVGLSGEANDEAGAEGDAGNAGAHAVQELQEGLTVGAALHAGENIAAYVLQGHVDV